MPIGATFILRATAASFAELWSLLSRRYPENEWATFARFGWRETPSGLVVTLAGVDPPGQDDVDERVSHVRIAEPYTLRIALASERHGLAVGVIHSHPESCRPVPSAIDDDMDGYYSRYFADFARGRPYLSLIMSRLGPDIVVSGRAFWKGGWWILHRTIVDGRAARTQGTTPRPLSEVQAARVARLASAFGADAAARLRDSTVAVVGAGGTGSVAIEVLARAGVGHLVIVDPDIIEDSNLERVHGSSPASVEARLRKVRIAKDQVATIDPDVSVTAIVGALPQRKVIDAVIAADVILGCTDSQHSRVALSDTVTRYLVPAIDCGVALEGRDGRVTGQIIQLVRFRPDDPCVYCRKMVIPTRLAMELISPDEQERRKAAALAARAEGRDPDPYWAGLPQLNTVGYLTTVAGALAAQYAIGLITGRFEAPFTRLQFNTVAPLLDVTDSDAPPSEMCPCRTTRGFSDACDPLITQPAHWPAPQVA